MFRFVLLTLAYLCVVASATDVKECKSTKNRQTEHITYILLLISNKIFYIFIRYFTYTVRG